MVERESSANTMSPRPPILVLSRLVVCFAAVLMLASCGDPSPIGEGPLPPDPGEAGKETLAGVDVDHDGVRDDIQRYLHFEYKDDSFAHDLMTEYALLLQSSLLGDRSDVELVELMDAKLQKLACLDRWWDGAAGLRIRDLLDVAFNTTERYHAALDLQERLPGAVLEIDESQLSACGAYRPAGNPAVPPAQSEDRREVIFYINGILTDFEEAVANQLAIRHLSAYPVALLYNPTTGYKGWIDFIEVIGLKRGESAQRWREWLPEAWEEVKEPALDLLGDMVTRFVSGEAHSLVDTYVAHYRQSSLDSNVVILAHSQGNFYANLMYDRLEADPATPGDDSGLCVDVVAVATPASRTVGSRTYFTLRDDLVIRSISSLPANAVHLPGRVYLPPTHALVDYLLGAMWEDGTRVVDSVRGEFATLADRDCAREEEEYEGIATIELSVGQTQEASSSRTSCPDQYFSSSDSSLHESLTDTGSLTVWFSATVIDGKIHYEIKNHVVQLSYAWESQYSANWSSQLPPGPEIVSGFNRQNGTGTLGEKLEPELRSIRGMPFFVVPYHTYSTSTWENESDSGSESGVHLHEIGVSLAFDLDTVRAVGRFISQEDASLAGDEWSDEQTWTCEQEGYQGHSSAHNVTAPSVNISSIEVAWK